MATYVLNTLAGAVSTRSFSGVSTVDCAGTGYVAAASGLYKLDPTAPVTAVVATGKSMWGVEDVYLRPRYAYILGTNYQSLTFSVELPNGTVYDYPVTLSEDKDVLRCELGRGIKHSYLGVSMTHTGDSTFRLDRIDVSGKKLIRRV